MASSIFSLPGAVLVTAMEVLLVARWSTDHEIGLRWVALAVFAINCGIVLLYTTMIHPDFISPLRNIVGPKVCLDVSLTEAWKKRQKEKQNMLCC